jgi:ribonuclease HI
MPRNLISVEVKKIMTTNTTLYVTATIHAIGYLLKHYNKKKNLFNNSAAVVKSFRLQNMDKHSIFRFVSLNLKVRLGEVSGLRIATTLKIHYCKSL